MKAVNGLKYTTTIVAYQVVLHYNLGSFVGLQKAVYRFGSHSVHSGWASCKVRWPLIYHQKNVYDLLIDGGSGLFLPQEHVTAITHPSYAML